MAQESFNGTRGIAIIGGGIAGLAAGIHAADAGHHVTLFERAATAGGRARSDVEDGFVLNLGPHALYKDADDELASLGVTVAGKQPPADGTVIYRGRRHLLPARVGSIMRTGLLGPGQKIQLTRAFWALTHTELASVAGLPLSSWLDGVAPSGRLRELLETYFRLATYANAPAQMDAGAALGQVQAGLNGVRYLDGGWQRIVDGLRGRAEAAGVHIETGARVDAIQRNGEGFRLALAGGRDHRAAAVIIATTPASAASLLDGIAPGTAIDTLRATLPAKAACLDVGLSRLPRPKNDFTLGVDKPLYSRIHTLHADLAPAGMHLISAAMYLPVGETVEPEASRRDLEDMLDLIQPGWREHRALQRFLPSITVSEAIPVAGAGRPAVDGAGIDGIAFAGDWAGDEGMLAAAALKSARRAAGVAVAAASRRAPFAAAV